LRIPKKGGGTKTVGGAPVEIPLDPRALEDAIKEEKDRLAKLDSELRNLQAAIEKAGNTRGGGGHGPTTGGGGVVNRGDPPRGRPGLLKNNKDAWDQIEESLRSARGKKNSSISKKWV